MVLFHPTFFKMRKHHIVYFVIALAFVFAACHKATEETRSAEAIERLKVVGDAVDEQSPQALALIDSALTHSPDSLTYYDYLVERGRLYLVQKPDSVLSFTDRIMAFANNQVKTPRINGLLAEACHLKANYLYLYHQNLEEALSTNLSAYQLFLKSDMQDNVPNICANIGDVYMQQSNLPEAATWYRRALVISDSLQLPEETNHTFYIGLGRIYCILKDYKLSEEYYAKARKSYDKMQANMKMMFLNNYGNLKYYKKEYEAALGTFNTLDSLIGSYGIRNGFDDFLCQLNMADVLLNLGRHSESMKHLEPADSFFRANNVGDAIYYANTIRIGNALYKSDTETVKRIIAEEPAGLTTDEDMINIRQQYLHTYYVKTNNHARASQIYSEYQQRKDSIDQSREHMRASDVMTRLMLDTLKLHNQLRLNEKNAEISRDRFYFTALIACLLLIALGLLTWTFYLRKRDADKKLQIIQLKIANDRNVIAPHFIFNVLKHATTQQGSEADSTIERIITLMRSQLAVSRKVMVTLREELDFTEDYIQVAEKSMDSSFTYTINRPDDDTLDTRWVPSTFVQILAENAIKHALAPKEGEKRLSITATATDDTTIITVEDNGPGFDIRRNTRGTGTGLSVISRTITLYNESHEQKIEFHINNLEDANQHITGCQNILVIPRELNM